jgi:ABC-type glycerol-3-phosphate transport system substrate-binding protein
MNPVNAGSVGSFLRDVGDRFEWDIMPTPKGPLTGRGGGLWNDQPHVVTSGAVDRNVLAESAELVLFLSGDEVQGNIAKDRGSCPTVAAIQESDDYMAPPPNNMAVVVEELKNQVGPKYFPRFLEWFNAVNKEFELGLIGERDADATIEAMVVEGDKILASI